MALTKDEKERLIAIVRDSIRGYLADRMRPEVEPPEPPGGPLEGKCGAFVTLHMEGALRGCIGHLTSSEPLYQTVSEMAVSAAFSDPRFPPLIESEFSHIDIEISVLTPMKRVEDLTEIKVGTHGLYIVMGPARGVLLPQVAIENGFDRETFLNQTCMKAGLAPDSWRKGAEIYSFEAEVFGEKEMEEG